MRRHVPRSTEPNGIVSKTILQAHEGTRGVKTAAGENNVSMRTAIVLSVSQSVDFHYPSHFSSVLGRKASGVNGERIHVVRFDFWAETRGAIVGERNAIDNELSLVLRTTGM